MWEEHEYWLDSILIEQIQVAQHVFDDILASIISRNCISDLRIVHVVVSPLFTKG